MAIILFLTGMNYSCKRGYIIPDRIDIHCELAAVPFSDLSKLASGEPSSVIRERVIKSIGYRNLDRGDWAERGI